jgi:outer membrane protein
MSFVRVRRNSVAMVVAVLAPLNAIVAQRAPALDTARAVLPSDTITLQDAIAIALSQNNVTRFARNSVLLDSLSVRSARNAFLPNLNASSTSSQGFGAKSTVPGSEGNPFSFSAGVSSNVTIYNGRQNVNTLRQAQLNVRASSEEYGRARQTVVFTVANDYLNLINQQEQLRVQNENLVAQEQELTQIQAFVDRGTRPIGDLYQEQAAVAQTRLAVINARRATEDAKVDLVQELVLDPRRNYVFVTPTTTATTGSPPQEPTFNLDSLFDVALVQRADLRAENLRVQAAQRDVDIARGTRLPTVTGSGGYSTGYNSGSNGSFFSQLDQRRGGSIGAGVSVPIFDRGASSIATQRALIALDNELLTLRALGESVELDVKRAFLDYNAAQEALTAANAQAAAAALALEAAQARYRVGAATFVEVTLARATLIQAQSAVVNARSSVAFQRALMSYFTGELDPTRITLNLR